MIRTNYTENYRNVKRAGGTRARVYKESGINSARKKKHYHCWYLASKWPHLASGQIHEQKVGLDRQNYTAKILAKIQISVGRAVGKGNQHKGAYLEK